MELNDIWYLAITELLYALSSVCVPKLHLAVISARQEPSAVVRKTDILDSPDVSHERSEAITVGVDIPKLKIDVRRCLMAVLGYFSTP